MAKDQPVASDTPRTDALMAASEGRTIGQLEAQMESLLRQLERELAQACRIGLAFIGWAYPDHPVTDEYVKQAEARLRELEPKP